MNSFRRHMNSTLSVMPFSLVHLPPSSVAPAQFHIAALKPSWSSPNSSHFFERKIWATRHLDFLIRLAVLFARLQVRESTLGPLRLERSFRCPAFAPTLGLAMCSNMFLARPPQLMNVRQIAMLWVSGDVHCANTTNHRVTDPTKRAFVLDCLLGAQPLQREVVHLVKTEHLVVCTERVAQTNTFSRVVHR